MREAAAKRFTSNEISQKDSSPRPLYSSSEARVVKTQPSGANGAKCNSLGHRPRCMPGQGSRALKARNDDRFGDGVGLSRFQRSKTFPILTQGVALGFPFPPWRSELELLGHSIFTAGIHIIRPLCDLINLLFVESQLAESTMLQSCVAKNFQKSISATLLCLESSNGIFPTRSTQSRTASLLLTRTSRLQRREQQQRSASSSPPHS